MSSNGTLPAPSMARAAAADRAAAWLYDVTAHGQAEALRTQRAVVRKQHGLDMTDLPYPGAVNDSSTNVTHNGGGALRGALVGALLMLAGSAITAVVGSCLAGGGLAAYHLMTPAVQQPTPPAAADPAKSATELVTWVSQDGGKTWQQVAPTQNP